ncbi:unnamed protein product [Owenia fusiformis]|uniref:Uncharacterized protein n=1 Tax=Owenia fusiformis TaxID=6347 RepID=A0A8J1UJS3_OWEFU|nr:unnamed protein product [Owenia fusiformis]
MDDIQITKLMNKQLELFDMNYRSEGGNIISGEETIKDRHILCYMASQDVKAYIKSELLTSSPPEYGLENLIVTSENEECQLKKELGSEMFTDFNNSKMQMQKLFQKLDGKSQQVMFSLFGQLYNYLKCVNMHRMTNSAKYHTLNIQCDQIHIDRSSEATCEEATCKNAPIKEVPVKETPNKEATCIKETPLNEVPCKESSYKELPYKEVPYKEAPHKETPYEETPLKQAESLPMSPTYRSLAKTCVKQRTCSHNGASGNPQQGCCSNNSDKSSNNSNRRSRDEDNDRKEEQDESNRHRRYDRPDRGQSMHPINLEGPVTDSNADIAQLGNMLGGEAPEMDFKGYRKKHGRLKSFAEALEKVEESEFQSTLQELLTCMQSDCWPTQRGMASITNCNLCHELVAIFKHFPECTTCRKCKVVISAIKMHVSECEAGKHCENKICKKLRPEVKIKPDRLKTLEGIWLRKKLKRFLGKMFLDNSFYSNNSGSLFQSGGFGSQTSSSLRGHLSSRLISPPKMALGISNRTPSLPPKSRDIIPEYKDASKENESAHQDDLVKDHEEPGGFESHYGLAQAKPLKIASSNYRPSALMFDHDISGQRGIILPSPETPAFSSQAHPLTEVRYLSEQVKHIDDGEPIDTEESITPMALHDEAPKENVLTTGTPEEMLEALSTDLENEDLDDQLSSLNLSANESSSRLGIDDGHPSLEAEAPTPNMDAIKSFFQDIGVKSSFSDDQIIKVAPSSEAAITPVVPIDDYEDDERCESILPEMLFKGTTSVPLDMARYGTQCGNNSKQFVSLHPRMAGQAEVTYGSHGHLEELARYWDRLRNDVLAKRTLLDYIHEEGVILNDMKQYLKIKKGNYKKKNQWRKIQFLGNGVEGKCSLAMDETTYVLFCVKKVHLLNFDPMEIQAWLRLMGTVHTGEVAFLYGALRKGEYVYLLQEFLEGMSLAQYIQQKPTGSLPQKEALYIYKQCLSHLEHFQKKQVIHNDFKAANLMVLPGEQNKVDAVVVIDFGLAKLISDSSPTIRVKRPTGTQTHWSPEKALSHPYNHKVDVWAATCVLLHMLTGDHPWVRRYGNAAFLHYKIATESPYADIPSSLPSAIQDIFHSGWTKDPDVRPDAACLLKHNVFKLLDEGFFKSLEASEPEDYSSENVDNKPPLTQTSEYFSVEHLDNRTDDNNGNIKSELSDDIIGEMPSTIITMREEHPGTTPSVKQTMVQIDEEFQLNSFMDIYTSGSKGNNTTNLLEMDNNWSDLIPRTVNSLPEQDSASFSSPEQTIAKPPDTTKQDYASFSSPDPEQDIAKPPGTTEHDSASHGSPKQDIRKQSDTAERNFPTFEEALSPRGPPTDEYNPPVKHPHQGERNIDNDLDLLGHSPEQFREVLGNIPSPVTPKHFSSDSSSHTLISPVSPNSPGFANSSNETMKARNPKQLKVNIPNSPTQVKACHEEECAAGCECKDKLHGLTPKTPALHRNPLRKQASSPEASLPPLCSVPAQKRRTSAPNIYQVKSQSLIIAQETPVSLSPLSWNSRKLRRDSSRTTDTSGYNTDTSYSPFTPQTPRKPFSLTPQTANPPKYGDTLTPQPPSYTVEPLEGPSTVEESSPRDHSQNEEEYEKLYKENIIRDLSNKDPSEEGFEERLTELDESFNASSRSDFAKIDEDFAKESDLDTQPPPGSLDHASNRQLGFEVGFRLKSGFCLAKIMATTTITWEILLESASECIHGYGIARYTAKHESGDIVVLTDCANIDQSEITIIPLKENDEYEWQIVNDKHEYHPEYNGPFGPQPFRD